MKAENQVLATTTLQSAINEVVGELTILHSHFYPDCHGGCPCEKIIEQVTEVSSANPEEDGVYEQALIISGHISDELSQIRRSYPASKYKATQDHLDRMFNKAFPEETNGQPPKYTQQMEFMYGWDYVGSDDEGNRILFDTEEEAYEDLADTFCEWKSIGYDHDPTEWRVVPYIAADDDKSEL